MKSSNHLRHAPHMPARGTLYDDSCQGGPGLATTHPTRATDHSPEEHPLGGRRLSVPVQDHHGPGPGPDPGPLGGRRPLRRLAGLSRRPPLPHRGAPRPSGGPPVRHRRRPDDLPEVFRTRRGALGSAVPRGHRGGDRRPVDPVHARDGRDARQSDEPSLLPTAGMHRLGRIFLAPPLRTD